DGFRSVGFDVQGGPVLGPRGARVLFPWVGERAARAARLRIGPSDVQVGGGPPAALAASGWTLEECGARSVRATLRTDRSLDSYPFRLTLIGSWILDEEGLLLEVEVANRSKVHAPFGLGVRVELAPLGERILVLAPAEEHWPLDRLGALSGQPPVGVDGRF